MFDNFYTNSFSLRTSNTVTCVIKQSDFFLYHGHSLLTYRFWQSVKLLDSSCNSLGILFCLQWKTIFRHICKIVESDCFLCHVCLSVCQSVSVCPTVHTWNNTALTRQIFMKIYIWGFLENLLSKLKFYWNRIRIMGTLDNNIFLYLSDSEKCFRQNL
jgi:hypothetical protein